MVKLRESAVTLRFRGDDLEPEEISNALGVSPDKGVRKGETWFTPKGFPAVASTGMWHFRIDREAPGDLDKQIPSLFSLMNTDLDVWTDLSRRFEGHLFVGLMLKYGNEGIGIQPRVLAAIGARGLRIDFDIYSGRDDIDDLDTRVPLR